MSHEVDVDILDVGMYQYDSARRLALPLFCTRLYVWYDTASSSLFTTAAVYQVSCVRSQYRWVDPHPEVAGLRKGFRREEGVAENARPTNIANQSIDEFGITHSKQAVVHQIPGTWYNRVRTQLPVQLSADTTCCVASALQLSYSAVPYRSFRRLLYS